MNKTVLNKVSSLRNISNAMTILSVVGLGVTVYFAIKDTVKAQEIIADGKSEKEILVEKCNVYIPTIACGIFTGLSIISINSLNKEVAAALTAAYAGLYEIHRDYRKTLIQLHGKETDEEILSHMARVHSNYHQLNLDVPDRKVVFFDDISGNSIEKYEREIMDAEYHINRNYALRGYVMLNEVYDFMGLPQTNYGNTVGWGMSSGISWIDFEHHLQGTSDRGIPVYSIVTIFPPTEIDDE